ncbi:hypothetical protein OHA83_34905 [Streptomyces canus]
MYQPRPVAPHRSGRKPCRRHEEVAMTANYIHSVISTLRELVFGETPPASSYRAGQGNADATV